MLVTLPLLVIAAGAVVMLLGRRATVDASESMARRQLAAQAANIQHDVAFALDQADPLLASLRQLTDPDLPIAELFAARMRDLVIGRPGIANVSMAFPSGVMRGSFLELTSGEIRVQESRVGETGTERTNYGFATGSPQIVGTERTSYDPRTRPHWQLATRAKTRASHHRKQSPFSGRPVPRPIGFFSN